jgi:hypothetical protein
LNAVIPEPGTLWVFGIQGIVFEIVPVFQCPEHSENCIKDEPWIPAFTGMTTRKKALLLTPCSSLLTAVYS